MQDVGSKEDTELRRKYVTLRLARVACRIPWTLSVRWKLNVSSRSNPGAPTTIRVSFDFLLVRLLFIDIPRSPVLAAAASR